jgi:hypothetical protein
MLGHLTDCSFSEHLGGATETKKHGGLDILDDIFELHAVCTLLASKSRAARVD